MAKVKTIPIRPTMCATCPYRPGSPYADLQDTLTLSAISETSRVCHNTGGPNAVNKKPGKPARICRGSRDIQLKVMFAFKIIEAPTDAAWAKAWAALQAKRPRQRSGQ